MIHDAALARAAPVRRGGRHLRASSGRRIAAWPRDVESSLAELRASRARILAAADDERQRIERDLHDGGQQRLVALRIRLELAGAMLDEDPSRARRDAPPARRRRGRGARPSCARWRPGSTPRCSRRAGSPTQSGPPRCSHPCPRRWRSKAPTAIQARSRPPPTSAASRRSRTWPSTRPRRARCGSRIHRNGRPALRGARRRPGLRSGRRAGGLRSHEHARSHAGRGRRAGNPLERG